MAYDRPQNKQRIWNWKLSTFGIVLWQEILRDFATNHYGFPPEKKNDLDYITYSGQITAGGKRRLKKALDLLQEISEVKNVYNHTTGRTFKLKLAFQTLTLSAPQLNITDSEIKKNCLEPYLRSMKKHGMKNYVWKAEQQKNGNLHFHIITDTFIDWQVIRDTWNRFQNKLFFVDRFFDKHGHHHPNSTDVMKIRDEKTALKYMLKYMLKNVSKEKQLQVNNEYLARHKGKIWDCSLNLKMKFLESHIVDNSFGLLLNVLEKDRRVNYIFDDFFILYLFKSANRDKLLPQELTANYYQYLEDVKNHNYSRNQTKQNTTAHPKNQPISNEQPEPNKTNEIERITPEKNVITPSKFDF